MPDCVDVYSGLHNHAMTLSFTKQVASLLGVFSLVKIAAGIALKGASFDNFIGPESVHQKSVRTKFMIFLSDLQCQTNARWRRKNVCLPAEDGESRYRYPGLLEIIAEADEGSAQVLLSMGIFKLSSGRGIMQIRDTKPCRIVTNPRQA